MSRSHQLAWAAGFFDGEGFVSIVDRKTKHKNIVYTGLYLRIGINHVAPEPLIEIQKILGGKMRQHKPYANSGKRKVRHGWVASTDEASKILIQLLPYLCNKNKVVELALEFQKTMQKNKQVVPEEIRIYRKLLQEQLQNLNSLD